MKRARSVEGSSQEPLGRRRWPQALIVFVVLAGNLAISVSPADATDAMVTYVDVHGPDDAGAQADLSTTSIDYSHLLDADPTLFVDWTWDEIDFSGKNTGDACAMFDTTGDGLANYAICVTITGNPAVQALDSPRLYECTANNLSATRCNGDTLLSGTTSTCTVSTVGTDTLASCEVDMDDVGGGDATLSNTCSFNSSEPNSNPPDCVLEPGMGITVVKDVSDDAPIQSDFSITIDGVGTIERSVIGDYSFFIPLSSGTHSIAEIGVTAGYILDTSSCTTGTPDTFVVTLGATEAITCTFVNRPAIPSSVTTKTFDPTTVEAGSTGNTFTIEVLNDGETSLTNVAVSDLVDPALVVTSVSSDLSGDCSASAGNTVDCLIASIPLGATATITVTYDVDASADPATITNTALVTSDELPAGQKAGAIVDIVEDVVLSIEKLFTADPVDAGSTGNSFTIVVTNDGISDADNVTITDLIDPALAVTGVSISPTGDCSASAGQSVDCTVASLGGNESVIITVTYDVDVSAAPATISNTASVTSDEVLVPLESTATVDVVENVVLDIAKTFATDPVAAGSTGQTFSISVTNSGTSDAENVTIADLVPPELLVTGVSSATADCSASAGQTVDCTQPVVAPGETVTVVVTYDVAVSELPATLTNVAETTSDEITTPVPAATDVDIVEDVVLEVDKYFDTATVAAGSTGNTFTIELSNTGLSDAENVAVSDLVDPNLIITSVSSSVMDCSASAGQAVDCSAPTLAPGETVFITVTYDVAESTDPATTSNTASASSDEVTTPVESTATVDITEDVALTADKAFSPTVAPAGSTGNTFTLTVTNDGLSDADNVTIGDLVDPALQVTGLSIASVGDCSASVGQTVDCTLATLAAGQTVTVTVTYSIDSGTAPGPVPNTVDIASDEATVSAVSEVEVVADVGFQATKAFSASPIEAGSTGNTFAISVTNSGPSDATNVSITDLVPTDFVVTSVVSASADCSASAGQNIDCSVATLPAGQTATVIVTFDVAESVDAGTVTNTASVDATELLAPETPSGDVEVIEDVVLEATKTFATGSVVAGASDETFTLTIANAGSSDADNMNIVDLVPGGLIVTSVTSSTADCTASVGQSIDCSQPTLAAGASITINVTYDVDASVEPSTLTNAVAASSDEATASTSDDVTITEDVVLETAKTFNADPVAAGVTGQTFTITVTNSGLSEADNITISDLVDPTLSITSVTSTTADCSASAGQTVDCSKPTLGPGETITVVVTFDVDATVEPATVSNTADVASDEATGTATTTLTIEEDVVLDLAKVFSPNPVMAGATAQTLTLTVSNAGVSTADNVQVTDLLDPALLVTSVSSAPVGDCSASVDQTVDCLIASLDGGATATITVIYNVDPDADTATLTNTASASSDEVGPVEATDELDVVEDATLTAAKAFAIDPVAAGSTGNTFTITVTNTGVSTADNVSILDALDPALTIESVLAESVLASPAGDCSASAGSTVDCSIETLAPGEIVTVTVTFSVDETAEPQTITNTAAVGSDETLVPLEPSDTVDIVEEVTLTAEKLFDPNVVVAGSTGNVLTISVTNDGPSQTENLNITDVVDTSFTVTSVVSATADCSASAGQTVDCSTPTVAAGETVLVTITFDVPAEAASGIVSNFATVNSDEAGPIMPVDSATIAEDVQLTIEKLFLEDPVVAGSIGNTFTIEVTNEGASNADNVSIADAVDPALAVTGVSISPVGDCSASVGNTVSCAIATLGPGESALITVTYDVPATTDQGTVSNTASATSEEVTTPVASTATVEVIEDVVLEATKTFVADPVAAGTTGNTFTLSVTNSGLSDAENVSITDLVPVDLAVTAVSITPSGDCSASAGQSVDCSVATLAPGTTVTVIVTYDVAENVDPSTMTNTASVTSDEVTTPIEPTADVELIEDVALDVAKSFASDPVTAGVDGYTFAIEVTNTGTSDAENVSITDLVDTDFIVTGVSISPVGDCSASAGQNVDCVVATLAAGATAVVTVTFDVDPSATVPQTVSNTASVTSDEITTAVEASDATTIDADVAFVAEKAFADPTATAGTTGNTFTITVANSGPSDATGVAITDLVDPRLAVTNVSISPFGDCSPSAGQSVDCTIATIPLGEVVTVTVTYTIDESVDPASLTNTATVDSAVPAATTEVSATVGIAEDVTLEMNKAFASETVDAGTTGNVFNIQVTNTGASDADNVVISDLVDPALTVTSVAISPVGDCSASAGQVIDCSVPTLAAGQAVTVTVIYDVAASIEPTVVTNTASVTSDEVTTPVQASDTLGIAEDVLLGVVKAFASDPVAAGTTGNTFTITVSNTGTSDADNVAINDLVDPALTLTGVSISPVGDCSASAGQTVDCIAATLVAGGSVTVEVTYDVDSDIDPTTLTNTASTTSDEVTTPVVGTADVDVVEDVSLVVVKQFTADPVVAGSTGNSFTIAVANTGLSSAEGVHISDLVDATLAVTSVSISPAGDCSASAGQTVDCTILSLAAGETATVLVGYDVDASVDPTSVANTASVVSDEVTTPIEADATVDVVEDVTLEIAKAFGADPVTAGIGGYTFTLQVTNTGLSDADNVIISDIVDPAFTVTGVAASPVGDCAASAGQSIECAAATLGTGQTMTVTVTFTVDPSVSVPVTLTNTASVTSDEVATPIEASASTSVIAESALTADKVFGSATAVAGSTGNTFTITVANGGPSEATGVTIADIVDPRLTVTSVAIAPIGDCSASAGNTIDCGVATLPVGQAVTLTVTYDLDESIDPATVINTVNVGSEIPGSTTTASASVEILEDVVLDLTKQFTGETVIAGTSGNSFTVAVSNLGISDADNVIISDAVDPTLVVTGVAIVDTGSCSLSAANNIECLVPTLAAGQTVTVLVTYDVPADRATTSISNTATAGSDEADPVTGTAVIGIAEQADLSVTKEVSPDPVISGEPVTYVITVSNAGPSQVTEVLLTEDMPASLTNVVYSPSAGTYDASTGVWSGLVLDVGESIVLTITADTPPDGTDPLINTVQVAPLGDVIDPDLTNNVDVVQAASDLMADLNLTKTVLTTDPVAGEPIEYEIVLSNAGPGAALDALITDNVSSLLLDPVWTCSATGSIGASCGTTNGTGDVSTVVAILPDDIITVLVSGTLPPDHVGDITNTASVASSADPTTAIVTATAVAPVGVVADLGLTKTVRSAMADAGDRLVYDIVVFNAGPSTSPADTTVTDTLPEGTTFVSADPATGCSETSSVLTCILGAVAPGAETALVVELKTSASTAGTDVVNTATVSSSAFDPVENNTDAASTTIADAVPPAVAFTGANSALLIAAGFTSIAAGSFLVVLSRRRLASS